ncbi:MAG: hypothetical protein CYPHOPRED_005017 [Cyphobasidiales sp. Tagirdzhanova-0007]|nr:MAG: hypothetical protein CYPHOPRED_005017 [Cyphobasidiales sp. Tagirdzhanova-0007]
MVLCVLCFLVYKGVQKVQAKRKEKKGIRLSDDDSEIGQEIDIQQEKMDALPNFRNGTKNALEKA